MRSLLLALISAVALLIGPTDGATQEQAVTSVVLQAPSVNVQQTFAYGERRGFFEQEGVDLRIVVIRPHLATATLLSGDTQFTAQIFRPLFMPVCRGAAGGRPVHRQCSPGLVYDRRAGNQNRQRSQGKVYRCLGPGNLDATMLR